MFHEFCIHKITLQPSISCCKSWKMFFTLFQNNVHIYQSNWYIMTYDKWSLKLFFGFKHNTERQHVKTNLFVCSCCLLLFYFLTVLAKDAETKEQLEKKDLDLEEMRKRLKNQERERQAELLKLQMEVNEESNFIPNNVCLIILMHFSLKITIYMWISWIDITCLHINCLYYNSQVIRSNCIFGLQILISWYLALNNPLIELMQLIKETDGKGFE